MADDYEYFGGNTQYDSAFFIDETPGMGLSRGRVEVCSNNTQTWGVVCDNDWTNTDASVACRQLGFSPYGITAFKIQTKLLFIFYFYRRSYCYRYRCRLFSNLFQKYRTNSAKVSWE